jgi:acyl-CoA dehydrogenase
MESGVMTLLNPKSYSRFHPDPRSKEIAEKTIAFFEKKGLEAIKEDDQASKWHQDFSNLSKRKKLLPPC